MKDDFYRNFITLALWALILGSYGWTTFITADLRKDMEEFENETIRRDQLIQNDLALELRKIDSRLASIETELKLRR